MDKIVYNFFDIHNKDRVIVIASIESEEELDIFKIKELWYKKLCFENDFTKNFQLDNTYFILYKDKIIGIFTPHFGYSFFDVAEHDERVMIKRIFPRLKCHIIGEG